MLVRQTQFIPREDAGWCGRRESNPHDVAIEGF